MVFSRDFRKLLVVCLKMLFRKSTRKRFVFLVFAFLFMMGFNTCSYLMKFHKTETLKRELLAEKAFRVFFTRMRSSNDFERFLYHHRQPLQALGAHVVQEAFIYQNNLYIHFMTPGELETGPAAHEKDAMVLMYDMFNIRRPVAEFYTALKVDGYRSSVKNQYVDYNGNRLDEDTIRNRHETLKADLIDIADMIRALSNDKRKDVINSVKKTILDNLKRAPGNKSDEPNLYLSRVEAAVPMNFLHIWAHIQQDNTTDIIDLLDSARAKPDGSIETDSAYLQIPEIYAGKALYKDLDIYPRYAPLYIPGLLKTRWIWLLYQDIRINGDFMDYLNQLHFNGHYLFSYEKSKILQDKVKNLNDDIQTNQIYFYLTDLSMGIAFPFMISLFAFIHLKTEIAFLLMYRNRVREILFIFWLLPLGLMFVLKGGILAGYFLYLSAGGGPALLLPLLASFAAVAAGFYPINRWCFNQFTGDTLNLYALHKGR
ncbi:MAG: hypothetical protein AB1427_21335 [Thermodesulfobacteriota bacterium]